MDSFCYLCFVFVFVLLYSIVITCWERVDFLVLLCVLILPCVFVTFPYDVPGKV